MSAVYIAASSQERARVRAAQALAAGWGWRLTMDWLTEMEQAERLCECMHLSAEHAGGDGACTPRHDKRPCDCSGFRQCYLSDDSPGLMRGGGADRLMPADAQRSAADRCLVAVASADLVWLLAPTQPTVGAWVELGFALGIGFDSARPVPVVVSGAERGSLPSILAELADVVVARDEDVAEAVRAWRAR